MSAASFSSSALAGVMMPSPLNFVSAKIFVMSAVSSRAMESFSSLRFARICFAEARSFAPFSFSSLKAEKGISVPRVSSRSGSFRMPVSHSAVAMTSSTRMFPSWSTSMSSRVFWSNSRFFAGQLRTVHSLRSSSPRWAMSAPEVIFTRTVPPTEVKVQLYLSIISVFWCFRLNKIRKKK